MDGINGMGGGVENQKFDARSEPVVAFWGQVSSLEINTQLTLSSSLSLRLSLSECMCGRTRASDTFLIL